MMHAPPTIHAQPPPRTSPMQSSIRDVAPRVLLAAGLVASGTIHLRLWFEGYDHVPTIGDLFLAQAAACALLGVLILFAPHRRLWVTLGGLVALGTASGLVLAATVGIFGFHDAFSAPLAGASLAAEALATLASLAWLIANGLRRLTGETTPA